jgi:predicted RNA-binding protein YlxR (DUF448 family)
MTNPVHHKKDAEFGGSSPERKCIATGEVMDKSKLVRFVVGPDTQLYIDIAGKLPGRGIWVSATRAALEKAVSKGLFPRVAKQAIIVPENLVQDVEAQLVRRVVDLISLARKSGKAVSGYEKVKDWLLKEEAHVLIQASDGSERGKTKLSTPYGGTYIGWLTANELGAAFSRETTIHCALATGGLTRRVVEDARRLKGLRVSEERGRKEKTAR